MLRRAFILPLLFAVPLGGPNLTGTQTPSLEGTWRIVEVVISGVGARTISDPQPGLVSFHGGYYSYLRVRSDAPSTANAGTYEISGKMLIRIPMVAKDPATMSKNLPIAEEIACDGDTLWLTTRSAPGQPESETRIKLTRVQPKPPSQPVSPLTGTWTLNLEKSTYDPARLMPKSLATTYAVTATALHFSSDGVNWEDRLIRSAYTANLDGKDYPWAGGIDGQPNTTQDAVSIKKIDDYTYDVVNKLKGEVVTTQRIVIARDGRSYVTTATGRTADGQAVHNVMVFDRRQDHLDRLIGALRAD
jgi:hypothetical protein